MEARNAVERLQQWMQTAAKGAWIGTDSRYTVGAAGNAALPKKLGILLHHLGEDRL